MYADLANNLYMVLYIYRNNLSHQSKDNIMTHTLERTAINNTDDLVCGAGLPARIASVSISNIVLHKALGLEGNTGGMSAYLHVVLDYDAGYSIGASYVYQSKQNMANVDDAEARIAYAKDGVFDFDIDYQKDDYMPFKNWWVQVDEDVELLTEIIELGTDNSCENAEDFLGEGLGFEYDEACREVAYDLKGYLDISNGTRQNAPISAVEFDSMARQAMVEYLEATRG